MGRSCWLLAATTIWVWAANATVAATVAQGAQRWGAGSGASHLVSGHLEPFEQLETRLAAFTGFARALFFSTGYMANLAIVPALVGRGDAVFADRLNHASLIDAGAACARRPRTLPAQRYGCA